MGVASCSSTAVSAACGKWWDAEHVAVMQLEIEMAPRLRAGTVLEDVSCSGACAKD